MSCFQEDVTCPLNGTNAVDNALLFLSGQNSHQPAKRRLVQKLSEK